MKILIVGYGLAGIYATEALKTHDLEIITDDITGEYRASGGKAGVWGGILYHYSRALYYSRLDACTRELGNSNLKQIKGRLNANILENNGVLFKNRESWFRHKVDELSSRVTLRYGRLIEITSSTLTFDSHVKQITDYDKVFILVDQMNLINILQRSKILDDKVYIGDHYSREENAGIIYDTHFLRAGNLQIVREPKLGKLGNIEYYHTIPLRYNERMENLIKFVISRDFKSAFRLVFLSLHQKWVWWILFSLIASVKLRNLVPKGDLVTKLDRDVRPGDELLSVERGNLCVAPKLAGSVSISHEYGLDDSNLKKLIDYNIKQPNIYFNPSLYIKSLGPANLTLPLFQILEEQIRDVTNERNY